MFELSPFISVNNCRVPNLCSTLPGSGPATMWCCCAGSFIKPIIPTKITPPTRQRSMKHRQSSVHSWLGHHARWLGHHAPNCLSRGRSCKNEVGPTSWEDNNEWTDLDSISMLRIAGGWGPSMMEQDRCQCRQWCVPLRLFGSETEMTDEMIPI